MRIAGHGRPFGVLSGRAFPGGLVASATGLVLAVLPAAAVGQAAGRAVQITPSVSVTETITSNASLSSRDRRADAITQLSAGVSAISRRAGLQGSLDYQLTGSVYARETSANNVSNALRSTLRAELIDNFLSVDASASISQQAISAFGVQTADPTRDNSNRTEVRSYSVSPVVQTRVGNWGQFQARYTHLRTESSATQAAGDAGSDSLVLSLGGSAGPTIGWGLNGQRSRSDFEAGRSSTTDTLTASLTYRPNPDLMFSGRAGRERSDLTTSSATNSTTWGLGVDWTPTPRSRVSLKRDRRFFGDTHSVAIEHRMQRTNFRFTSSRDISTAAPSFVPNNGVLAQYQLRMAQLAAEIPDMQQRDARVWAELQAQGLNVNQAGQIGFVTSDVTLVNRQDLSAALQGLRTTATFTLYRSETRSLNGVSQSSGDLARGGLIRQSGINLSLGHRLTPSSSLSLSIDQQRNRGTAGQGATDLLSINLNWSAQLGRRSSVSLAARHANFDSPTSPYVENAVIATYGYRF